MFSLICVWIKGWVNNREAGDLRRYHAHFDVIVMCPRICIRAPTLIDLRNEINFAENIWTSYVMHHEARKVSLLNT